MNIMKPEDFPRMLVRDAEDSIWEERIIIAQTSDGSALALLESDEENFLKGKRVRTWEWRYCEPIPEIKTRPFKNGELPECYRDYWYRHKDFVPQQYRVDIYQFDGEIQLNLDNGWRTNATLYYEWEVQIDGVWQKIGVKYE